MSKLGSLTGKPKTFTIGGIELEIKPLTLGDADLIFELQNEEKRGEAMKNLIKKTLKDSVPDASDEEINAVGMRHFKELSEAIVDVNGLEQ